MKLWDKIKKRLFGTSDTEIERKFLVDTKSYYDKWHPTSKPIAIAQGYLSLDPERTVRVRLSGRKGYITIKGKPNGIVTPEYEFRIPVLMAFKLLDMCIKPILHKDRYVEEHDGKIWEIDVFHGENKGLIVAEVELDSEDESILLPSWVSTEVTSDPRYKNANLIKLPYQKWS